MLCCYEFFTTRSRHLRKNCHTICIIQNFLCYTRERVSEGLSAVKHAHREASFLNIDNILLL